MKEVGECEVLCTPVKFCDAMWCPLIYTGYLRLSKHLRDIHVMWYHIRSSDFFCQKHLLIHLDNVLSVIMKVIRQPVCWKWNKKFLKIIKSRFLDVVLSMMVLARKDNLFRDFCVISIRCFNTEIRAPNTIFGVFDRVWMGKIGSRGVYLKMPNASQTHWS